jgi:hypothetical protein
MQKALSKQRIHKPAFQIIRKARYERHVNEGALFKQQILKPKFQTKPKTLSAGCAFKTTES